MASKAAEPVETTDVREDAPDSPLLDSATQAVKKETFKRRVMNSQYRLLMGREMRHAERH